MTIRRLIRRSLRFHWRAHLGVVLGAAVGSAALIGALIVGDSVRESLRERALERLGPYAFALSPSDRFFTQQLAERMRLAPGSAHAALRLPATAARQDGSARANQISVIGVLSNFWGSPSLQTLPAGSVLINEALAAQLNARPGDEIILRTHKATALSRDVPITPQGDASVAVRLKVHAVVRAAELGNLSLRPSQTPPMNAFVNLAELQRAADLESRANLILAGALTNSVRRFAFPVRDFFQTMLREHGRRELAAKIQLYRSAELPGEHALATFGASLYLAWQPADAELELRTLSAQNMIELGSRRIFLDPAVEGFVSGTVSARAGAEAGGRMYLKDHIQRPRAPSNAVPILTYLANQIGRAHV